MLGLHKVTMLLQGDSMESENIEKTATKEKSLKKKEKLLLLLLLCYMMVQSKEVCKSKKRMRCNIHDLSKEGMKKEKNIV